MKQIFLALATSAVLFSCHNSADQAAIEAAKQEAVDSVTTANAIKQQVIDSMKEVKAAARERHAAVASQSSSANTSTSEAPATTTTTTKKKGWSHTAKGAVVGAGAGAITGALVNPDHVKGAAIGTLIGAGVGAGTGAIVDHAKKKKEANQ